MNIFKNFKTLIRISIIIKHQHRITTNKQNAFRRMFKLIVWKSHYFAHRRAPRNISLGFPLNFSENIYISFEGLSQRARLKKKNVYSIVAADEI